MGHMLHALPPRRRHPLDHKRQQCRLVPRRPRLAGPAERNRNALSSGYQSISERKKDHGRRDTYVMERGVR